MSTTVFFSSPCSVVRFIYKSTSLFYLVGWFSDFMVPSVCVCVHVCVCLRH
jgi:hypothetical protein